MVVVNVGPYSVQQNQPGGDNSAAGRDYGKALALLQIMATAQSARLEPDEIQQLILNGIRQIIHSDFIILALLDSEQDGSIRKKVLAGDIGWVGQLTTRLEKSILEECIRKGQIVSVANPTQDSRYNPQQETLDGSDPTYILCIPLIANDLRLGAIELICSTTPPVTQYEEGVVMSMANTLANAIYNGRLIQQLKIANADLEANRWELLRSRNTLRALFDSIPSSIYIVDQSYNLVAVNISRSQRAKNKPSFLVGDKCYKVLFGRPEPCVGCQVGETLLRGGSITRNVREWISNDQLMEWEISTYAIRDDKNDPFQAIVIEQDVTEKRRLESNLAQSEKLAAVGQLAAGVAHEINNPLAAIIANAQILSRELPKDSDMTESVQLIEQAGMRASQVVKNLLGFARKEQFDFGSIDLNDNIRGALSILQHELVSRPVSVDIDLDEGIPLFLGSTDHLQGVWINMILNALDALGAEGGKLSIASRFFNNEFRVTITDTGHGIPPEKISRIFEPFYTTKAPGRGTGLGLSVCHRTIKQHGGYIAVDSQIGKGTVFTIVLPADGGSGQAKSQRR